VPALTARATANEGVKVRASSHLYFFGGTPPSGEPEPLAVSVSDSELTASVYARAGVSICTFVLVKPVTDNEPLAVSLSELTVSVCAPGVGVSMCTLVC